MIERVVGEDYVVFMKRVVDAVKNHDMNYLEMGEALLGGESYSSDNLRKAFYVLDKVCNNIDDKYKSTIGRRILVISDLHVPFQLPIETFSKYVGCVDILMLNGDLLDLSQISKFKGVKRETPLEDIITTRQYIIDLIEYIKPKEVYANYGNHELRFSRYLERNLDNDLCQLLPKTPLGLIFDSGFDHYNHSQHTSIHYDSIRTVFPDKKIIYTGNWYNQIGDALFVHPRAFNSGTLKTSERAMNYFLREGFGDFRCLFMAHTHRCAEVDIGAIRLYETGCCCDVKANAYNDGNMISTQKEGFVYIIQDENGKTIKELTDRVVLN